MEWRNRDWKWVTGILIGIIILLVASIFAKNTGIEVNFSIISSAVSIALALVAIFFAFKQDSDNRRGNDNLEATLQGISREVGSVKNHVFQITKTDIQEIKEKTYETTKLDDQKSTYTKEEVDSLIKDTISAFSDEIEEKVDNDLYLDSSQHPTREIILKRALEEIIWRNGKFSSVERIQRELKEFYNIEMEKKDIFAFYKKYIK